MGRFGRKAQVVLGGTLLVLVGGGVGVTRFIAAGNRAEAADIASALQLEPGSSVADVGAGKGTFSIELARKVGPDGQVFATEIDEKLLKQIRRAATDASLHNVTVIEGGEADAGLPEACCDAVFLRGVYHHLTQPATTNASLFRALRPGGRLAIIDFPPSRWLSFFFPVRDVPANRGGHGVPAELVIEELTAAGFALDQRIDDWRNNRYCLVFRRGGARQHPR
ncbi:MAG: methyltransferase domain-containing protein [Luteitalea sp.]|nr:methyltransferase domain-containing protein [Luteitalea sp.]